MDCKRYQKAVFGGYIVDLVPELKIFNEQIEDFFSQSNTRLANDESSIKLVERQIDKTENNINDLFTNLADQSELETCLNGLVNKVTDIDETYFLSDKVIEKILNDHPPTNIISYINGHPDESLNDPRTILSLTRFSENRSWLDEYNKSLKETTLEDYEIRKPACVVVSRNIFHDFEITKPWGVSHSKETGQIICFDNSGEKIPTPRLLMVAVLFHYLYEVSYASQFTARNGERLLKVIAPKKQHFQFLTDGNSHDETIYWRRAIKEVSKQFDFDETITTMLSETIGTNHQNVYSLHPIDVIWDYNGIHSGKNIYHLQQEVWLSLLEFIYNSTNDKFEELVLNSLHMNNEEFFVKVLNKT